MIRRAKGPKNQRAPGRRIRFLSGAFLFLDVPDLLRKTARFPAWGGGLPQNPGNRFLRVLFALVFQREAHALRDLNAAELPSYPAVCLQQAAYERVAFPGGGQKERITGNRQNIPGISAQRIRVLEGPGQTVFKTKYGDKIRFADGDIEAALILTEPYGGGLGLSGELGREDGDRVFQCECGAVDRVSKELVACFADKVESGVVRGEYAVPGACACGKSQLARGLTAAVIFKNKDFIPFQAGNQQPALMEQDLMAAGFLSQEDAAYQVELLLIHAVDQHVAVEKYGLQ